MEQRSTRWLAGAFAAAGLAAALFVWQAQSGALTAALPAPVPAPAARPAPPAPSFTQPAGTIPAAALAAAAAAATTDTAIQPLSAQVARLLSTHDPRDAYTAYMLVASCAMFNDHHDLTIHDDKLRAARPMNATERTAITAMCRGMTERERLARLDYLATAVEAGVPGAAWTFAAEGPFGDPSALATRPDDPLVQEWKARAGSQLDAAAKAGDATSLMLWGMQNLAGSELTDKQPVQGYAYLLALGLIEADRAGPDHPTTRMYAPGSEFMMAMAGNLTPQQRAAGLAEARRIAAGVKARRLRAANGSA